MAFDDLRVADFFEVVFFEVVFRRGCDFVRERMELAPARASPAINADSAPRTTFGCFSA